LGRTLGLGGPTKKENKKGRRILWKFSPSLFRSTRSKSDKKEKKMKKRKRTTKSLYKIYHFNFGKFII